MKRKEDRVFFGYFPGFADPTILFAGTGSALLEFAQFLRELPNRKEKLLYLSDLPLFQPTGIDINIQLATKAIGMKKIDEKSFIWGISPIECKIFAKQVYDLAGATNGGHHDYLDCDVLDDVVVKVSVGEYDNAFFENY
jgi:hypothetical protein